MHTLHHRWALGCGVIGRCLQASTMVSAALSGLRHKSRAPLLSVGGWLGERGLEWRHPSTRTVAASNHRAAASLRLDPAATEPSLAPLPPALRSTWLDSLPQRRISPAAENLNNTHQTDRVMNELSIQELRQALRERGANCRGSKKQLMQVSTKRKAKRRKRERKGQSSKRR